MNPLTFKHSKKKETIVDFFKFLSDGHGNVFYIDEKNQKVNILGDGKDSLKVYCKGNIWLCNWCNLWNYNSLTDTLSLEHKGIGIKDDRSKINMELVQRAAHKVEPYLTVKPVINPFTDRQFNGKITPEIRELMIKWQSIFAQIEESQEYLEWYNTWINSGICGLMNNPMSIYLRFTIVDTIYDACKTEAFYDVIRTIAQNVKNRNGGISHCECNNSHVPYCEYNDEIFVYATSFFDIEKYGEFAAKPHENPFQCCIDLWEMGIIPAFPVGPRRYGIYYGKERTYLEIDI